MATSFSKIGIVDEETDQLKVAARNYGRAWYLQGLTLQVDASNFLWRSSYATMADHVGDVLRLRGRYPDALRTYADAFSVRDGLVQEAAKKGKKISLQWRVDLATSYDQMGATLVLMGDQATTPDNAAALASMIAQMEAAGSTAVAETGSDPDSLRALAGTCFTQAKVQLDVVRKAPESGNQRTWQNEIALNDDGFGSVQLRENTEASLKAAAEAYAGCIGIESKLTASEKDNIKWKHEYGINLLHLAEVEIKQGAPADLELASKNLELSKGIMEDLVKTSGQDDGQFLHDMAKVLDCEAGVAEKKADLATAAKLRFESLEDQETVINAQEKLGGEWVNAAWMTDMKDTFSEIQKNLDAMKDDKATFDEYAARLPALSDKLKTLLQNAHMAQGQPANAAKEATGAAGGSH